MRVEPASSPLPAALAGSVIEADSVRSWVESTLCVATRSTMSSACSSPARASRSSTAGGDVREHDAEAVHVVEGLVEPVLDLGVEQARVAGVLRAAAIALEAVRDLAQGLRRAEAVGNGGVPVGRHEARGRGHPAIGVEVDHERVQLRERSRCEDVAVGTEVDQARGLDELVLAQVIADLLVADARVRLLRQVREDVEVRAHLGQVEDRDDQERSKSDGDGERAPRDGAREAWRRSRAARPRASCGCGAARTGSARRSTAARATA